MSESRITAASGWLADWRLHRDRIRIMVVRRRSDAEPMFESSLVLAPDLVEMRELFPDLGPLWDAVHHDFWQAYRPGGQPGSRRRRVIPSDTVQLATSDLRAPLQQPAGDRRTTPQQPTGDLRAVSHLPTGTRIPHLALRARKSGYRLVRESLPPYLWTLRDADDGERILSARTLDEIEHWLDT